jgi:hypothetical protein
MTRFVTTALVAAALALAAPAYAAAPPPVEQLTRIASQVSGLKPKRKIKVVVTDGSVVERQALTFLDRDYPREQQAYDETLYRALGLLNENEKLRPGLIAGIRGVRGVYDPVSMTLWARKGADVRDTLLRQLVHALQDQYFGLKRVASLRRGSRDASSAAYAAVDGSAALFSEVVRRRPQARLAANPRSKLYLDLLASFPSTTGLRFAASLQNVGGRAAVHSALKRMPETTEQIFHVDAFLARQQPLPLELPTAVGGYELVRDDTFGELDVRALLAVYQVPRLDRVGTGWGAGLSALYRGAGGAQAVTIRLDWDTERDAQEWSEAVTVLVNEAFDADVPGFPAQTPCEPATCWTLGKRGIAFTRTGSRTVLAIAADAPAAATVATAIVP